MSLIKSYANAKFRVYGSNLNDFGRPALNLESSTGPYLCRYMRSGDFRDGKDSGELDAVSFICDSSVGLKVDNVIKLLEKDGITKIGFLRVTSTTEGQFLSGSSHVQRVIGTWMTNVVEV